MVAYYLLGHSIELSFKSYLFAKGYPITILRDQKQFCHNLSALLVECRKRKLGREVKLSSPEIGAIHLLSNNYRMKKFEYLEYGTYRLPDYYFLYALTRKIVNGLASYAMKSTRNRK